MLSKRDFLSIGLMMLALLFIFQFSQVMKSQGNNYDVNEFAGDNSESNSGSSNQENIIAIRKTFETLDKSTVVTADANSDIVWFVGDKNSGTAKATEQWCFYRKCRIEYFKELPEPDTSKNVKLIVFDSKNINFNNKVSKLQNLAEKMGSVMIFNGTPDVETINWSIRLKEFLGITEVINPEVRIEGIQMFDGFLLSGETIYKAVKNEEIAFQNLELTLPWFKTGLGTKTYMVGLMDEEKVSPYDFPKIMWRNYYRGAFVFVINGNYIDEEMGLGFIDSCMYETSDFYLYPVVNANNIAVANFPYLSNENNEGMEKIYSRDVKTMLRDVAWPSFVSMVSRTDLKLTCFITTKYNYDDNAEPSADDLPFYLQQLKEVRSEAGKSIIHSGSISLKEKLAADAKFYEESGSKYNYRTILTDKISADVVRDIKASGFTAGTVVSTEKGKNVVDYLDDEIMLQSVTANAGKYSYKDDLTHKSLLTSLGYSTVMIDMNNVVWRESYDDEWQNYFDLIYSNMTSYWSKNLGFDQTTASESDARIRTMLASKYEITVDENDSNVINVKLDGVDEAWFVLRTHSSAVDSISNGSFEKIGEFAYLIKLKAGETRIYLDDTDEVFRYRVPF